MYDLYVCMYDLYDLYVWFVCMYVCMYAFMYDMYDMYNMYVCMYVQARLFMQSAGSSTGNATLISFSCLCRQERHIRIYMRIHGCMDGRMYARIFEFVCVNKVWKPLSLSLSLSLSISLSLSLFL